LHVLRKKLIKSPAEIICYACSFLRYWAGLQKENDKAVIPEAEGAHTLQATALALALEAHRRSTSKTPLLLTELGGELVK
jgi:hypothetical protein